MKEGFAVICCAIMVLMFINMVFYVYKRIKTIINSPGYEQEDYGIENQND